MKKEIKEATLALCEASFPQNEEEKKKYIEMRNNVCDVLKKKKKVYTAEEVAAVCTAMDRLLMDSQIKSRKGLYEEAEEAYGYYKATFDAIIKNGETVFDASAPFMESIMSQAFDEKSFNHSFERAKELIKKCKKTIDPDTGSDLADLFEVIGTLNWYASRMSERKKEGAQKAGKACIDFLHLTGELRDIQEK